MRLHLSQICFLFLFVISSLAKGTPLVFGNANPFRFSPTRVGDSAEKIIQVHNKGTAPITLLDVTVGSSFHKHTNCLPSTGAPPLILAPGERCWIRVVFKPLTPEQSSSNVIVTYRDNNQNKSINREVSGLGLPGLKPAQFVFGNFKPFKFQSTPIGQSVTKTFRIKNIGEETGSIQSVTVSNAVFNASNCMTAAGSTAYTLRPGEICSISVTFSPKSQGPSAGSVLIRYNKFDKISRELSGEALPSTRTQASLSELGELNIQITGAETQLTLYQENDFYRLEGVGFEGQPFELSRVKSISVQGDASPSQVFKVAAHSEVAVRHALKVDPSIETTLILGKINTPGEVNIGSPSIILGADITSSGAQIYKGKVELSGNRQLDAQNSPITFESDLESSLLVFADPDSAPIGTDLSTFFPDITLSGSYCHRFWGQEEVCSSGSFGIASVKSSLQLNPQQVYAPTGSKVFGISNCNEGCDGWDYFAMFESETPPEGNRLLRFQFKKPFRSLSLDFTPRSLDPAPIPSPLVRVFAKGEDKAWLEEPQTPLAIAGKTKSTVSINQSSYVRPFFAAEAGWASYNLLNSYGIIDHFQGTLWERPLQTLVLLTHSNWNCAGKISDRLNIATRDGMVTPPRSSHSFEGKWAGQIGFTNELGQRHYGNIELNLTQETNEVVGSFSGLVSGLGRTSTLQGSVVGTVSDNDLNIAVTLTSEPCSGTTLNLKITEYEGIPPTVQMVNQGFCSSFQRASVQKLERGHEE